MRDKEFKVRLSENEYNDFFKACNLEKVNPSARLRELVSDYSQRTLGFLSQPAPDFEPAPIPSLVRGRPLTVGEMFSGPGGIGIALNRTRSKEFSFVHRWATDWDPDACRTYRDNVLKDTPTAQSICADVRHLEIDDLPTVDGFLYGFPCNDFSLVGESKGLGGNYGGL